jgi:hypothetical protein
MAACPHLADLVRLPAPTPSQSVHREECTQCFDNQDGPLGVDVCLVCFNGACLDPARHHARTHAANTGHAFTLNVRRVPKPSSNRVRVLSLPKRALMLTPAAQADDQEPPSKMTKLAIVEEREEDRYERVTALKCWRCDPAHGAPLGEDAAAQVCPCPLILPFAPRPNRSAGQTPHRRRPLCHVVRPPVRGESLGRGDPPLRAHPHPRPARRRPYRALR